MLYPKPIRKAKPKFRGRGDLRAIVITRDRCVLSTLRYPGHVCVGDLSLEHVPTVHGPTDVRRDDPAHCVGLCIGTNLKPPTSDERDAIRAHLRMLFPTCGSA